MATIDEMFDAVLLDNDLVLLVDCPRCGVGIGTSCVKISKLRKTGGEAQFRHAKREHLYANTVRRIRRELLH